MIDMDALLGASGGFDIGEASQNDTSEVLQISALALLKMLKHGRAGVPLEVMGLMLGEFVDEYTVRVVDVFAMPQSGTGVSVEAVDPVFQTKMLDMLKQVGRPEMVVGWYHSHPGFGPWLSSVDINTQASFEQLNKRAVALVIDPIQSVRGRVVMDAFRVVSSQNMLYQVEPRQTTSNLGHLQKPSMVAIIHGLNRHYYSMRIEYRRNVMDEAMLLKMSQRGWTKSLVSGSEGSSEGLLKPNLAPLVKLTQSYAKSIKEEAKLTEEEKAVRHVGKQDPRRHLKDKADNLIASCILGSIGLEVNAAVF